MVQELPGDQNGNNILNTFSQGQLGVFMLAYFFANMFKRKKETPFKTYFIDDITSCMDDINILSFVDIIKYQLYQNDGVINQFFFSTCNGDLEKLFMHKMKSFDIGYINYKFNSYARGEIFNNDNQIKNFGN
jgi:exonuclease SbcC